MNQLAPSSIPSLTAHECGLLLAISKNPSTGYGIARQYELDLGDDSRVSNGMVYPALKRLGWNALIESTPPATRIPGRGGQIYRITKAGRLALEWHLATYRRLVRLGADRL